MTEATHAALAPEQLWMGLSRFVTGNFGISLRSSLPMRGMIEAPLFLVWIADLARAHAIGRAGGLGLGGLTTPRRFWWRRSMPRWRRRTP